MRIRAFGTLAAACLSVVFALFFCFGKASGAAPIFLAFGLPMALASSASLRRDPAIFSWIAMTIPGAIAFWGLSSGRVEPAVFALSAVWVLPFGFARGKAMLPLAALSLLVAAVAYFSSGQGGAEPMVGWYERYGLTEDQAKALTLVFRKTVHFTFYGLVGWTTLRAAVSAGASPKEAVRTALFAALAVAVFDELRQSGYANRQGSAVDVALDFVGAATFVGLSEWRRSKAR